MISKLLDLAQLGIFLASFAGIVFVISRSALAGAIVVLGAFLLFEATSPQMIENVVFTFGSVSVYPIDVTSLALLLVAVPRLFVLDIRGPARLVLAFVVLLLATHLVWGLAEFGVQRAVDHSRLWLPIVSGVVYGATVRAWDRRLPAAFIATGSILATLSVLGIARHGLFEANKYILVNGELVDARPVSALGVLVMLEGLILLLARGRLTVFTVALAVLLASGVVLLQYRTLWVVALVCLTMGCLFVAARFRSTNERVVYLATGAALIVLPFVAFAVARVGTYQQSVESATGSSSTLAWRVDAWRILLSRHNSPFDVVFGTPSGTSREIDVSGLVTNLNAHNLYVEALLLFGLVGFLALCALWAMALAHRSETAEQLGIAVAAIPIIVVCQLLVSMTHIPDQVQGLLLGSMLSMACFGRERSPSRILIGVGQRKLTTAG